MIKVVTLCSGSKGNSTYIETSKLKILVDAGKNCKYITESLNSIGVALNDINYLFLTHNHDDHVSSLKVLLKKSNVKLYSPKELYNSLKDPVDINRVVFFEDIVKLDDLKITAIKSSHDAPDSRNYIIEDKFSKISIITDTGYVKQKNFNKFYNSDLFLMESNHDIDMLQNSSYPHYLKQRILSDNGHLSNNQAGFYLSKLIGPKTKKVLLIHLSAENNDPQIAINTINKILKDYEVVFSNIDYARQFELSEVIEID